jgi:3',5'-cyclic AMP phosphodiesterase CpdA
MTEDGPVTTFAHLSDLHIDGGERNAARTARAVAYLADLPTPVGAVLITGDLTEAGRPVDYSTVLDLVAPLEVPVLCCPGNHDERAAFRGVLLGMGGSGPVNQAHDLGDASILLCDSTIPGDTAGELSADTLAWLDKALDGPADRPAFITLHHPPVPLGIPELDVIALRNPDALAEVLSGHPRAAAIFCGHAHTAAASTFAGLPVRVAPGVKSTTLLPWEHEGAATNYDLPVGLAFHLYTGDVLTTHFRYLGEPAARVS